MVFNKVVSIFRTEPTVLDPAQVITHVRVTVENFANIDKEDGIFDNAPILPARYFQLVYKD
jgi:hypothetical protein